MWRIVTTSLHSNEGITPWMSICHLLGKRQSGQCFPSCNGVYCSKPSKQYLAAAHPTGGHVTQVEHHRRGRHVLLGAVVWQSCWGVVNSAIVLAAARGIQKDTEGGYYELGRGWAESFMQRIGFVMRKATKTAVKLPPNSEELEV